MEYKIDEELLRKLREEPKKLTNERITKQINSFIDYLSEYKGFKSECDCAFPIIIKFLEDNREKLIKDNTEE